MVEKWKAVVGYENLYEVSNLGKVRSLPRNTTSGRIMRPYINKANGYAYIVLCKDNKKRTARVHVLVMNAFDPRPKKDGYDKRYTIDHKDGDKTNNALMNLEWCTQSENQKRAYALGINGKTTRAVIDLTTGEAFESEHEAAMSVGGHKSISIHRVCVGQRSQYRNHRFAFLSDFENGTIPEYRGRIQKKSAETLWR